MRCGISFNTLNVNNLLGRCLKTLLISSENAFFLLLRKIDCLNSCCFKASLFFPSAAWPLTCSSPLLDSSIKLVSRSRWAFLCGWRDAPSSCLPVLLIKGLVLFLQENRLRIARTSRRPFLWRSCWLKCATRRGRLVSGFGTILVVPAPGVAQVPSVMVLFAGCQLSGETGPNGEEAGPSEPRPERRSSGQSGLPPHPAGPQQRVRTQQLPHGQVLLSALQSIETRMLQRTDERAEQRGEPPQQRWADRTHIWMFFSSFLFNPVNHEHLEEIYLGFNFQFSLFL